MMILVVFIIGIIAPPQSPPTLNSISDITIDEGVSSSFAVSSSDVNGDAITYSLVYHPEWVTINGDTITINAPDELFSQNYPVTVQATDNDGSDTESFTININEINQTPILSSIEGKSIQETSTLSFTLSSTDSDRPSQSLSYSMSNFPTRTTINETTGLFSWAPTDSQSRIYSVTFTVTDNGSPAKLDSETVSITVINKVIAPSNTLPILEYIPDYTGIAGDTISFTLSATDSDVPAQTFKFSMRSDLTGIGLNPSTGEFT